jgi:hypothetical protein
VISRTVRVFTLLADQRRDIAFSVLAAIVLDAKVFANGRFRRKR